MGGGSDRAAREAQQAEQERRRSIAEGTSAVNRIFDAPARQQQYSSLVEAVRKLLTGDLTQQKGIADRRSKFALARSGLVGGSQETDSNIRRGEEFQRGALDIENRAQGAGADLRAQDEGTRSSVLQSIYAGMDATTAAQRAGSAMQANAGAARGQALAGGLGDIFGSSADTYRRQEEAAERRRGVRDAQGSIYGRPWG